MTSTSSIRIAFPQARLVSTGPPAAVVIPLDRPVSLIGSGDVAHLRLHSRHVDTVHAVILNVDGRIVVRDLASRTGVVVNGSRAGLAVMEDGDEVTFGRTGFRLERGDVAQAAVDQPSPEAELRSDKWRLTLTPPVCLIGSGPGCDAPLPAEAVAEKHALACAAEGGWMIRGLEPNNLPRLNGRAKRRWRVPPDARVGIGAVELVYVVHPAAEPRTTTATTTTITAPTPAAEVGPAVDEVSAPASPETPESHEQAPEPEVVDAENLVTAGAVEPPPTDDGATWIGAADVSADKSGVAAETAPAREPDLSAEDVDDVDDDDDEPSRAGIDYEAIRAWGPLAAAVAGVGGGDEARARKPEAPVVARSARRWMLTGAALGVLLVGALCGWLMLRG